MRKSKKVKILTNFNSPPMDGAALDRSSASAVAMEGVAVKHCSPAVVGVACAGGFNVSAD